MPKKSELFKTGSVSSLLHIREKRKWQIALRRYVLERNNSVKYAPYFGLDINNLRKWFELQFLKDISWQDFAKKWHFGHVIPVTYFDFSKESELKLCWNFSNLKAEQINGSNEREHKPDILLAKIYFAQLCQRTNYAPCNKLLEKINEIEVAHVLEVERHQKFIAENIEYLQKIALFSQVEFELLNNGRSVEDIQREMAFLKKFEN